ncbi:MAG: TetR/AcrR family transcriptional regulator [Tannerella sp.]|jgi:AcrR family transcriptional regulator|nr:TetR/AcrR family transcriptional regulator [Tannerella sp.]
MELREKIIQGASALFFRNGARSMTMSDIANELGISKRTLYEVFRDKEELLEECIKAKMIKVDNEMKAIARDSENVIDALMLIYSKQLSEAQGVNKSLLHDLKKYHAHIYEKVECRQKDGYLAFIPLMQKGIKQGLIRKDVNFEVIVWLVRAQFKALIEDEFIPTDKYSTGEFIGAIILNFIRGISTLSGYERIEKFVAETEATKTGIENY